MNESLLTPQGASFSLSTYPTLLDGDVSGVGGRDEAGLGERVLEGEELVLGDGGGPRLEHGPRPDGRQVLARGVAQRQVAPVVLAREVAVLGGYRR